MRIIDIVNKFDVQTKADLIQNYIKLGLKASGNWSNELESIIKERSDGINIKYLGSQYTQQLITGRRPNKNQSKDSLRSFVGWAGKTFLADWVKQKGSKASPFAVAYKIAREGITVPNKYNPGTILSNVFNDERIEKLLKDISVGFINEIKSDIKTSFK
jgi:hypothetical protein